jgi:ABC-type enterochelin transport system ATPase subunit
MWVQGDQKYPQKVIISAFLNVMELGKTKDRFLEQISSGFVPHPFQSATSRDLFRM